MVQDTIRSLAEDGSEAARERLLSILADTDEATVRNAAALALSDLGEGRLVSATEALLHDPRTAGARGTLVYALEPLDARPIAMTLVEVATTDAFEASRQAYSLLASMGPTPQRDACRRLASSRLAAAETDEQRAWLESVVDLFGDDGEDTT